MKAIKNMDWQLIGFLGVFASIAIVFGSLIVAIITGNY